MRFLGPLLLTVGLVVFAPRAASAQPCQTHNLPELNTVAGTISNADCVMTPHRNARGEFWNVYANTGETLVITMNRVTMGDPYLYLLNPAGVMVASNDDAVAPNRNSRIQYVAAATGMHRVIATTFALQPTADNGTYEIRLEIAGHPACQVRNLAADVTMNATIDATDCIVQPYRGSRGEIWTIAATAGDTIGLSMERFTLADPYLFLLNDDWQVLASNDDAVSPNRDARISFAAPYTGTYRVVATTFAASDPGAYSITFDGGTAPTPTGLPGPPGQPAAIVSSNQVNISWTPPTTGATPILEYILEAGTVSGGTDLGSFSMGTFTSVVASVANGTYFVRVRARNSVGTGPASPERTFTIGVITVVQPPRNLSVVVSGRRVTLSWLAPTDGAPDTYRIEVGNAPGTANLLVSDFPGNLTSIVFDNAPSGVYHVRMRAVRGGAVSGPSNEIIVLVL